MQLGKSSIPNGGVVLFPRYRKQKDSFTGGTKGNFREG